MENVVNGISRRNYEGDFYEINEKLINLRKPLLTESALDEINAMRYATIDPEGRSFGNVANYVREDDILEFNDLHVLKPNSVIEVINKTSDLVFSIAVIVF